MAVGIQVTDREYNTSIFERATIWDILDDGYLELFDEHGSTVATFNKVAWQSVGQIEYDENEVRTMDAKLPRKDSRR